MPKGLGDDTRSQSRGRCGPGSHDDDVPMLIPERSAAVRVGLGLQFFH